VEQLGSVSLEEIGFRERQDLQRWIEAHPEIVGAPGPRYWQLPDGRTLAEVAGSLDGTSEESSLEGIVAEDD